ncbi:MAG: hypothetical protein KF857_05115 [Fimbriimonadaceae bacterium]|nr:hypothetical protein [Fimbriimonadaceae bacterium]
MDRTAFSVVFALAATLSYGSVYFMGSRTELAPNGLYDVAEAGRPGSRYPDGVSLQVRGSYGPSSLMGTVSGTGAVERQDEGDTWHGDFAAGAALLWTAGNSSSLTFRMSKPVGGLGTSVGAADPGAYVAKIEALGEGDAVLATFVASGFNNGAELGEAPYLGVVSDAVDIHGIRLSLVSGGDLAITNVDVRTSPVPEPHLWAATLLAGAWWLRRRAC